MFRSFEEKKALLVLSTYGSDLGEEDKNNNIENIYFVVNDTFFSLSDLFECISRDNTI